MSAFVRSGLTRPTVFRTSRSPELRPAQPKLPRRPREPSLRGQLVLLVASVALALVMVAGLAVWSAYDLARATQRQDLLDTAGAVARLVDREFATGAALLRGLAVSPQLIAGDYAGFDAQARAAAPPGAWIVGFDRTLRHLLSTGLPRAAFAATLGDRPASPGLAEIVRGVLATGRPGVGDVLDSPAGRHRLVAIAVPVPAPEGALGQVPEGALGQVPEGAVAQVLVLAVPLDRITAALADLHLPAYMRATVRDAAGRTIAAAGPRPDEVGSAPDGKLDDLIAAGAGNEVVTAATEAGGSEVIAVARAPDSRYAGTVAVPADLFAAPARRAVLLTALAGGLIAAGGCLAAALLGRRLATALRTLATPGGPATLASPDGRPGLREVADLARDLAAATAERDRAIAELRALFDASPIGLARGDVAGRILDANEAFRRLLRISDEDLADGGLRWDGLTPCEWRGIDEMAIAQALARGSCQPYEKEYLRTDMHRVPALVSFARLDPASGQVAGFLVDLTARKAAETALRETGTRLRAIFDGAFEFIFLLTPDGTLIEANRAALDFAGVGRAGVLRQKFWQTVWWSQAPAPQARLRAAIAEAAAGSFARYETSFRGAGGRLATVDFSLRPVRDEAGAVVLLIPEARDVTEWRSAQAALAASERRLALAQEAAGVGTWEWTIATDQKTWSDQQYRIYGIEPNQPAPRLEQWLAMVVPEDRARARAILTRAAATGADYRMEFSIRRASDGEVRRISAAGRGDWDDEGRVRSLVGVNLDMTEARHARAALRSAETRLLLAQEAAGIGFFDRDVATGAMAVTPTWRAIYGLPPEAGQDLCLDDWLAVMHPGRSRPHGQRGRRHAADLRPLRYRVPHRQARYRRGALAQHPRPPDPYRPRERGPRKRGPRKRGPRKRGPRKRGPGERRHGRRGRGGGGAGGWRDPRHHRRQVRRGTAHRCQPAAQGPGGRAKRALTDAARALSAEIRRGEAARAALLQAQKLGVIGELTSGVVHDFNNVLSAIGGSFELLGRSIDDAASRHILDQGQRAVARATGLIRQLLAFARKSDARHPAVIEPAKLLAEASEFLRQGAGPSVACVTKAADGVWPVLVDPHQLEVALLNLVVNARDAMPAGGTITISAGNHVSGPVPAGRPSEPDMVALAVCDTGLGMTGDVLARAAEPFFTTKDKGRGTGLGLAMVKEFAARAGGHLRIDSRLGHGTTVSILLPRAGTVPDAAPGRARATDAEAAAGCDGVILFVEANEPVRIAIAAFLRGLGYTVIDTARAETGLVLASALDQLDLLLADAEPPEGADLAARIRAARPGTPVLSMTACVGAASAGDAIGRGRPFSHADLAAAVRATLGHARSASAPQAFPAACPDRWAAQ